MARKPGKKFTAASQQIEKRPYSLEDAIPLVQKIKFSKFDETVELHLRLGVDPKHAGSRHGGAAQRFGKEKACPRDRFG